MDTTQIVNVETTPDIRMITCSRVSIRLWSGGACSLPSTWWIRAIPTRVLVESQRTYGVTLLGPVADDPIGKPVLALALTNHSFWSIGIAKS